MDKSEGGAMANLGGNADARDGVIFAPTDETTNLAEAIQSGAGVR